MQSQPQKFVIVLFVICTIFTTSRAAPTNYDQRQDGKLNVHANLKNFLIIIAPISDTSSSASLPSPPPSSSPLSDEFDTSELSLSSLLDALEFRKNLLAKNKLEHKSDRKMIDAIPEAAQTYPTDVEDYPKETEDSKIEPAKKKAAEVAEFTIISESIENCGPGRFRDRAGICQSDGTMNI